MKQLFYFKNSEFKAIGCRFFSQAISQSLFYNGTFGYDGGEILIYYSAENDLKTNQKADPDKYHIVNKQLAVTYDAALEISVLNSWKKAGVYSRDLMTVSSIHGLITQNRVRNRAYISSASILNTP